MNKFNKVLAFVCIAVCFLISSPFAEGGSKSPSGSHKSSYATGVKRNSSGKIARSAKAKNDFMRQSGFPKGRPGYVVDHIVPLKRGGAEPWQKSAPSRVPVRPQPCWTSIWPFI